MKLVERHIINRRHKLFAEIDALCFASKNLYNQANYQIRQEFFKTGQVLRYGRLDKLLQATEAYKSLPAKVSQQVLILLTTNWQAFLRASEAYKTQPEKFHARPKIPNYKDKQHGRNILVYTIQAISKPYLKKRLVHLSKTTITFPTQHTNIHQVRIVPRLDHYVIEVVYELAEQPACPNGSIVGVDIGLANLAAVTSNKAGVAPFLINGRPLKAYNAYFNKCRAKLQAALGQQQTMTRQLQRLTHKRNCKIAHYLHQASKFLIEQLRTHDVRTLVIGKNPEWKQAINLGRRSNQNFVAIPHAQFIAQLQYKAQLAGIEVIIVEESYTSKCSFLDHEQLGHHESYLGKRVHRGLFRSAQGTLLNADINGAANIIRKVFPNAFADGIQGVVVRPVRITPGQPVF